MEAKGATNNLLGSIATDLVAKQVIEDKTALATAQKTGSGAQEGSGAAPIRHAADDLSDEDDLDNEDDPEYRKYREKRMAELKAVKQEQLANKVKGHGEYKEIDESEFLPTVTKSHLCVCHFYHNDFERCKIVDMHLKKIAMEHTETRFVKINADKCIFFVTKLQVKVLPTIVFFVDGVAVDRLVGFEELGGSDDFPTLLLVRRLVKGGVCKALKKIENPGFHVKKQKEEEEEYDDND